MSSVPKVTVSAKIVPHLWFVDQAVEAANFYVSLFPDSRVDSVTPIPADTPSGPAGSVPVVEFTLAGQPFMAISAGPLDPFNHAISFLVNCDDQAEIDRLWNALSEGGTVEQCGWLRDRYGVSWQISPTVLGEMIKDPDRERARRVMEAMLGMQKLDIAGLERAYAGPATSGDEGMAAAAGTDPSHRRARPGKFVWFEHVSGDARSAQTFYGEVLGWKVEPWGDSGYDMILAGDSMDSMVGGYVEPVGDGQRSRWISYVSVGDVDEAARAAVAGGGKVVEEPHDLPGVGRVARITDPQGAELCLFRSQAGDPPDPPATEPPPPRGFFWCELHTTDPADALSFYEKVLGFTHETLDMGPAGSYHILSREGCGRGGVTNHLQGADPHWLPYVAVDDPDAALARAARLGGKVRVGPEDIPGIGRFGIIEDPDGAVLAVMKAIPPAAMEA